MEWRPIETAPRDGTWLLVFEPSKWSPNIHVVRWGEPEWTLEKSPPKTWVTMALGPNPDTYDADEATHWMPLPEPPTK